MSFWPQVATKEIMMMVYVQNIPRSNFVSDRRTKTASQHRRDLSSYNTAQETIDMDHPFKSPTALRCTGNKMC